MACDLKYTFDAREPKSDNKLYNLLYFMTSSYDLCTLQAALHVSFLTPPCIDFRDYYLPVAQVRYPTRNRFIISVEFLHPHALV